MNIIVRRINEKKNTWHKMCSTLIADNFINNRQTINEYSFEFLHNITGFINNALNRYLFSISCHDLLCLCRFLCYQILEILPVVHMCTIAQMNLLLDSHYRNIIVITGNYYIYSVEIYIYMNLMFYSCVLFQIKFKQRLINHIWFFFYLF